MRIQQKAGASGRCTVLAECEIPINGCREFVMPEKLRFLLKKASNGRKVIQESYVAGVDRKTGRGRKNLSGGMPADSTGMLPPDGRTLQYRLKAAGKEAGVPWITFQVLRGYIL